jgi:predicted NAD/FAD-binding protein
MDGPDPTVRATTSSAARRRIAVVGGGITGLAAAHALAPDHAVTLIEAEPRLGGHARTIRAGRGGLNVDTGFIVFNKANYPGLTGLFDELGVPIRPSDMSFAASLDGGKVEYATRSARTMFAQRRNLARPRFLRMVRDILRWNALAASTPVAEDAPLRDLLDALRLGRSFRDWYLGPMAGAIWSMPARDAMDFPAAALVRFFVNHRLLTRGGQHVWFTVDGGSQTYVARLRAALTRAGVAIRPSAPVRGVRREAAGVGLRCEGGPWERFDAVVLATHADDSLAMLADATPAEAQALGRIRYRPNRAVTHRHAGVMARRRACWASWTYAAPSGAAGHRPSVTYWMNRLQGLPADDPVFVSLNPHHAIPEAEIYDETVFRHPVYDLSMARAVEAVRAGNGAGGLWFCGAWMGNGFHEDGLRAGHEVAGGVARALAPRLAAE